MFTKHLILMLLLLLTLPQIGRAQFTWITNLDNTITVTKYTGPGGHVTVPDTITDLPVTGIGLSAFSWFTELTSITMGTNLLSIGDQAFQVCTNLGSVSIPENVLTIGRSAFASCTSLTNVTFGSKLSSIGQDVFGSCRTLASINLPESITNIGPGAFSMCVALSNITIPEHVTSIPDQAFYACQGLMSVTLPNGITNIGQFAFYSCRVLRNATIPASVRTIGNYAFQGCLSLNALFFEGNAPTISSSAFSNNSGLILYYFAGTTGWEPTSAGYPTCQWDPQVPYRYTTNAGTITITTYIVGYTNSGPPVHAIIPSVINGLPVTGIASFAFYQRGSLQSIRIPNSVLSIGDSAFFSCASLTTAYFEGNAPSANFTVFIAAPVTIYYLPGKIGWGSTFAGRPTSVWKPRVLTSDRTFGLQNGHFGFTVSWASGMTSIVEACTDLTNPNWYPLATNTPAGDSYYFSDPESVNYPARFYRLRWP